MSAPLPRARSTFAQLAILLGGSIAFVLFAASVVLRQQALAGGTEQLRPMIEFQIGVVERLLAGDGPAPATGGQLLQVLHARLETEPPPITSTSTSKFPFARAVQAALIRAGRPVEQVRLQDRNPPELWIQLKDSQARWLVLPLPTQMNRVRDSALLIVGGAALVVFVAAAWLARRQSRPLTALAAEAPALIRGQPAQIAGLPGASLEVQLLAQSLVDAGAQAREQAKAREVMLAGISHDLRTPLARLRFALELETEGAARQAMISDVDELDALLGQFIAFARDGNSEALGEIRLDLLLGSLLQLRQHASWAAVLAPVSMRVRPLGLRRALVNLLDNAERHGKAPFALDIESSVLAGQPALCIRVVDHGGGFNTAQWQRLRLPFERGSEARVGSGSGLGLAIVDRFAQDAGGRLEFSQQPEGRFEARLLLPLNLLSATPT